jgi:hypothetical protein
MEFSANVGVRRKPRLVDHPLVGANTPRRDVGATRAPGAVPPHACRSRHAMSAIPPLDLPQGHKPACAENVESKFYTDWSS